MALAAHKYPGGDGPALLIAHGLFGSARNWGVIAKRLAMGRPVSAVDMRNHGKSPWFDTHSYDDLANDLAAEIAPGSDLLGHSMGGKAAMVLALRQPGLLRKLVVADIAPVTYSHSQLPMVEAMESLDLRANSNRAEAEQALSETVPDAGVRAFLLQSLDVQDMKWRLNLKALRAEMPAIMSFPDIDGCFEGPAFFLTGGNSDYVQPEHRERIKRMFPRAVFAKIPGAGHWLHAEKPREFVGAVDSFLNA